MRVGQNPGKFVDAVAAPAEVTVALLAHVPSLVGYYRHGLEVLKRSLSSVRQSTGAPHDLLVFDNGSCQAVRDYLAAMQGQGAIDYLISSGKNLGKIGAWNIIFAAAPGDIIAYTDSDIEFHDDWLESSLQVLRGFPNVGMVTSRPMRTKEELSSSTRAWAETTPEVNLRKGQLIPWQQFSEFDRTLGQSEEQIRARYESTQDWLLEYDGLRAFVGASHFQFLTYKSVVSGLLPLSSDRPMGDVSQLDQLIDSSGLLRLATVEPYVMHLGNWPGRQILSADRSLAAKARPVTRLLRLPLVRRLLLSLYDRIFDLYFVPDRGEQEPSVPGREAVKESG